MQEKPAFQRPTFKRPIGVAPKVPQDAPRMPASASEGPPGMSAGDYALDTLKNAPGSFYKSVRDTVTGLVIEPFKALTHYISNPTQYLEDWKHVPRAIDPLWKSVKDDYGNYYSDFADSFRTDPFRFIGDLSAVGSLGAGGAGAVAKTAGKVAAGAGRIKPAVSLLRFAKGANEVENALNSIDPLAATAIGLSKVPKVGAYMAAFGNGKHTEMMNSVQARVGARRSRLANSDATAVMYEGLSPDEQTLLTGALIDGDKAYNQVLFASNPKIKDAYNGLKDYFVEDQRFYVGPNKLVPKKEALDAMAIGRMRWRKQQYGETLSMEQARASIGTTHDPVFIRLLSATTDYKNDPFALFHEPLYRGGILSRAERRAKEGTISTDIWDVTGHHIKSTHDVRGKLETMGAIEENLKRQGAWITVNKGDDTKKLIDEGFVPLQGEFLKKYLIAQGRADSIVAEARLQKGDLIHTLEQAKEKFSETEGAALALALQNPKEVYVPKHVAAWINLNINPAAPNEWLGRILNPILTMGGSLSRYKALATVFSPRYWLQVIFSNSILAAIYGLPPSAMKYALKFQDYLPPEIRRLTEHKMFKIGLNWFDKWAHNLGEASAMLDSAFKSGMYVNDIVKSAAKQRLIKPIGFFFPSADDVKKALIHYGDASHTEIELLNRMSLVKASVADLTLQDQKANKILAKLELQKQGLIESMRHNEEKALNKANITIETNRSHIEVIDNEISKVWLTIHRAEAAKDRLMSQLKDAPIFNKSLKGAENRAEAIKLLEEVRALGKSFNSNELTGPSKKRQVGTFIQMREIRAGRGKDPKAYASANPNPQDIREAGIIADSDSALAKELEEALEKVAHPRLQKLRTSMEKALRDRPLGTFGKPRFTSNMEKLKLNEERQAVIRAFQQDHQAKILDHMVHSGEMYRRFPAIARDAAIADQAIQTGNLFYGSYQRLAPFERKIVRNVIPFYTFTKAMTRLAFKLPFMFPKRVLIYQNIWRAWEDIMEDETPGSSWLRNYAIIGGEEDGTPIAVRIGSFNPFSGLRTAAAGPLEIPGIFDVLNQHPIIRLAYDVTRGKVSPKPLTPGTRQVRLQNGEIWEWNGRGFTRKIATPPYLKYLWSTFPQSQILDAMVLGATQTDRGWLLNNDPVRVAFGAKVGQTAYPIGTLEKILTFAVPTTNVKLQELKQREAGRWRSIINEYKDEYLKSGPDRRANIKSILKEARAYHGKKYLEF